MSLHQTDERTARADEFAPHVRPPLTFKEASKLEAQPPSPDQEQENDDTAGEGVEEEDASEAVMGCDRMVHRTLSRTSLASRKPRSQKSSRSINRQTSNPVNVSDNRKGSFSGSLRPSLLDSTAEHIGNSNDADGKTNSESSHDSNEGDHKEDGDISPSTESEDEDKIIVVDWEGPDDPENPKKCVLLPNIVFASVKVHTSNEQLAIQTQMGSDGYHISIHFHFTGIIFHACPCI